MTQRYRLGIDLGGTKIEIVALDADGHERLRHRVPTPHGDYDGTLRRDRRPGGRCRAESGRGPGRGHASVSARRDRFRARPGCCADSNSVCLNGRPFKADLEALLGRAIRMSNDANCFALSEATDGAGAGNAVVFGAILGTGVGAGIVVDGQVLDGRNAIAGEWGHNPLPWPRDDERPGHRLLLRPPRMHRDVGVGPGVRARPLRMSRVATCRPRRSSPMPRAVTRRPSRRCTLRGAPCALAGARHQPARPGRHRARRRHVEHGSAVRHRAVAVGPVDILGPRRHAARAQRAWRFERRARRRAAVARLSFT